MALTALFLALILSLTACGNSSNRENEQAGSADQETEQTAALTLADGEAKLIYAKDSYAVAAFHGPDGGIGASFCDADGNSFGLTFGISWMDDYYFTSFREIDGFADRFSYFAGTERRLPNILKDIPLWRSPR